MVISYSILIYLIEKSIFNIPNNLQLAINHLLITNNHLLITNYD